MSTTTGHDLISRADRVARELSRCQLPVTTELWESFDTTAYRLMRELIGPGRDDAGACTRRRATLLRVIHAYPTPLRPPLDADFSVTEAARFVTVSRAVLIRRVREGGVPTHVVGGQPRISAADLETRTDITPSDPTDPHPLARLSTTLGVLADMVNEERRHPGTVDGLSDAAVRDATARVMSCLAVAARYTLRHGPIESGDRPLAVAQYADRSIDALGGTAPTIAGPDALAAPTFYAGVRFERTAGQQAAPLVLRRPRGTAKDHPLHPGHGQHRQPRHTHDGHHPPAAHPVALDSRGGARGHHS